MPQKSFHRTDRVSAQLRRGLGTLVRDAVAEHGLPSVSVSDVEVTRDLARRHPHRRRPDESVLPNRAILMEAQAEVEERLHTSANLDITAGWLERAR